jgi:hypothetical protein
MLVAFIKKLPNARFVPWRLRECLRGPHFPNQDVAAHSCRSPPHDGNAAGPNPSTARSHSRRRRDGPLSSWSRPERRRQAFGAKITGCLASPQDLSEARLPKAGPVRDKDMRENNNPKARRANLKDREAL